MKTLLLLFLLCLLLTQYKSVDGFIDPEESFNQANNFLISELANTSDAEKRQKIVNAIKYSYYIKTLF